MRVYHEWRSFVKDSSGCTEAGLLTIAYVVMVLALVIVAPLLAPFWVIGWLARKTTGGK